LLEGITIINFVDLGGTIHQPFSVTSQLSHLNLGVFYYAHKRGNSGINIGLRYSLLHSMFTKTQNLARRMFYLNSLVVVDVEFECRCYQQGNGWRLCTVQTKRAFDEVQHHSIIRLIIILLIAFCSAYISDLHAHLLLTCHYHLSGACRNSETI